MLSSAHALSRIYLERPAINSLAQRGVAQLIEEKGLERVGGPHMKHLEGRLWELRLMGRSGIARALHVTV